ncbi:MAG: DDE-type integrase/transposase/recombinase, partial [Bacteroidota bacterium]
PRMSRWVVELQDLHFNIHYTPGKENHVADQLSRPVRMIVHREEEKYLGLTREQFRDRQRAEPRWDDLINYIEGGRLPKKKYPHLSGFIVEKGLLYLCEDKPEAIVFRLVIPQDLKIKALKFGHEKAAGHLGQRKTILAVESYFYWPSLRSEVKDFVKNCVTCQQVKTDGALKSEFRELPPVTQPLARIGIDVTDMGGGQNGYRYILTIIDHYSRFVRLRAMRQKSTDEVCKNFESYIQDFGTPTTVILDNGAEFTSRQFRDLCQRCNIKLGYITPYHPEGNSVTERVHKTLKSIIGTLCLEVPYNWPRMIGVIQQVLNGAVHDTTGEQPHFVFFGRRAPRQIPGTLPSIVSDNRDEALEKAHLVIQETSKKMQRAALKRANQRVKPKEPAHVGDLLWIHREVFGENVSKKIQCKWIGPYIVRKVLRDGQAYEVEDPFSGQSLVRAADKVKHYRSDAKWLLGPEEHEEATEGEVPQPEQEVEDTRARRTKVPTRRYIEIC